MPRLYLIDVVNATAAESESFREIVSHEVIDKAGAMQVLIADLRATADDVWSDAMIIRFGLSDVVTMPNGDGRSFRAIYVS